MTWSLRPIDYMELLEAVLISIILSGVLWNVLAGYGIVTTAWLVPKILLTTSVLTGALVLKELNQTTPANPYR